MDASFGDSSSMRNPAIAGMSLIVSDSDVERAARRAADLESLISRAGGIAGPGSLGGALDITGDAGTTVGVA